MFKQWDLLHTSPLPASLIHKIAIKAQKQSAESPSAPLQDSAHAGGVLGGNAGVEQLLQTILQRENA